MAGRIGGAASPLQRAPLRGSALLPPRADDGRPPSQVGASRDRVRRSLRQRWVGGRFRRTTSKTLLTTPRSPPRWPFPEPGPPGGVILIAVALTLPSLPAWISDQIEQGTGQRARLTGVRGDAIYVLGSLAVDAVLTSLGEVWIAEYDLERPEPGASPASWRRTEGLERTGYLVMAARRYLALRALLPERAPEAVNCPSCRGTGDWHIFSGDRHESLRITGMICKECGGLGWR